MIHDFTTKILFIGALTVAGCTKIKPSTTKELNTTGPADVETISVHHNSLLQEYRSPFGAVATSLPGSRSFVRLVLQSSPSVERVRLRLWTSGAYGRQSGESWHSLSRSADAPKDADSSWVINLPIPADPAILYYFFEISKGSQIQYYVARNGPTGEGELIDRLDDMRSFQITVYDRRFKVPDWLQGAVVYQIFPDRFRNGDQSNDRLSAGGSWVYGKNLHFPDWGEDLCDPHRDTACRGEAETQFLGGDLVGIAEKLDYLKSLGVDVLYLNPVFESGYNHGYETQDYFAIDKRLGTNRDFENLTKQASSKGIRIVLDGVFNHVSADSKYFDFYGRWNADGRLLSGSGPGRYDNSGACEAPVSPFYGWFYFPAFDHPARQNGNVLECSGKSFESFWGSPDMVRLRTHNPDVQKLFYSSSKPGQSVGSFWLKLGASGWRFDVGDNVDGGAIHDPNNNFWEGFRQTTPGAAMIGEHWGDVTSFLLGREWDSAMNYRFKRALLSWMFDACSGNGCEGGTRLQLNDWSVEKISTKELVHQLETMREQYPPAAWLAMLNLLDSHDTDRVPFVLRKISNDDPDSALRKQQLLAFFQMTYPGSPMIYYGDEVGISADSRWHENRWIDDPYNRAPFPWSDKGLSFDSDLVEFYRSLAKLRARVPALSKGSFRWLTTNRDDVIAFERSIGKSQAVVVLNRSSSDAKVLINLGNKSSDALQAINPLNPEQSFAITADGTLVLQGIEAVTGLVLEVSASRPR